MGLTHSPGIVTIGPGDPKTPLLFKILVMAVILGTVIVTASFLPASFWISLLLTVSFPLN